MGLETENAMPVWVARFAPTKGETAYQNTIGTGNYTTAATNYTTQPDGLLVQATGGNIYWRADGNPADVNSFLLKKEDPPVIFPWVEGGIPYNFVGADASAHLVIQPVTVH